MAIGYCAAQKNEVADKVAGEQPSRLLCEPIDPLAPCPANPDRSAPHIPAQEIEERAYGYLKLRVEAWSVSRDPLFLEGIAKPDEHHVRS
jgi:hypothetical protein